MNKSPLERSWEIVEDFNHLKKSKDSGDHTIYFCPNCLSKRGKPDKEGKFYWSNTKKTGICFKCDTIFSESQEEDDYYTQNTTQKKKLVSSINSQIEKLSNKSEDYLNLSFDFPPVSDKSTDYLFNRNPFSIQFKDILDYREWKGQFTGIVFPFKRKDNIEKFQVRFINNPKLRYYTSPGQKLAFSPLQSFSHNRLFGSRSITLCEGVFDAIALLSLGYPNPIAVLGKFLTKSQIDMINNLMPDKVYIAMDQIELSEGLKPYVSQIESVSEVQIIDLEDLDPEEYLNKYLETKFSEYLKNTKKVIKLYNEHKSIKRKMVIRPA